MVASGPVYNVHANSKNFSLKIKDTDTAASIKSRAAKKLGVESEGIHAVYEWHLVRYALDDEEDHSIFKNRLDQLPEVNIYLSGPSLPQPEKQTSNAGNKSSTFSPSMVSAIGGKTNSSTSYDSQSIYSSATNSRSNGPNKATSIHLIASSDTASNDNNDTATIGGKSHRSTKSTKTLAERAAAAGVPVHKLAFDEFHNQQGVRTVIGSIGPIENVRMMIKTGHRHCYMAREFALQHGFIPKDAAPGFYGFSGITNLGSWPIRVGGKTVELQVMLVENSYFPVILGRSFMEKRHMKTNPLDQTHIIFQDAGESVPCDIVVVKDSNGNVIAIP